MQTNFFPKTRKPLMALASSLIMPGLGQLYNGQPTKGLCLFLGICVITPLLAWLGLNGPTSWLWIVAILATVLSLALYGVSLVDAFKVAKHKRDEYIAKPYNQAYIYILVFVIGYFFIYGSLFNYTRQSLAESFYIPSASNVPNLLKGDLVLADKRVNCLGCKEQVRRGDLAVFVYQNNRTILYLKRLIGLPGDQIDITDTDVKVNGKSIVIDASVSVNDRTILESLQGEHIFVRERSERGEYLVAWQSHADREPYSGTVPNGHVFVLGDNRDASDDSRRHGFVPLVDVVGKAKQVWLSKGPQGFRWHRSGLIVDAND